MPENSKDARHEVVDALETVFREAAARAADGKGKERHGGDDLSFFEQPIFMFPRLLRSGIDPLLFQAMKKIMESKRLSGAYRWDELLDAMVYLAAAVIFERNEMGKHAE